MSGSSRDKVFFEGVDCVPVMLDCTLEVSFLEVLAEMVVSGMVGSGFVGYIFRGMRIYFSQDHIDRGSFWIVKLSFV